MNRNTHVGPLSRVRIPLPDHAVVCGRGTVDSPDDVRVYGPGPSGAHTTAHRDADIGVRVNSRCFSGTVEKFLQRLDNDSTVTAEQRATALEYVAQIRIDFDL